VPKGSRRRFSQEFKDEAVRMVTSQDRCVVILTRRALVGNKSRATEARAAYRRALELAASTPERRFLTRRLEEL
jgi:predicted RNA polymerase sigma factor